MSLTSIELPPFLKEKFNSSTVADPNDLNILLFKAIRQKNIKMAFAVLEHQRDVNRQNENGTTPLFLATVRNHIPMVELLLEAGADVSKRNRRGETPLLRGSFWGYARIVELLLEKGKADPNNAGLEGWTPLHKSAFQGHVDVVSLLLKHHADPSRTVETTDGEFTPFRIAQWYGQEQTVRLFKKFGITA